MEKDLFSSRIRLRHIHCFAAVAQEQHLRKAADKLRLSQPAVSKTLSELEEMVGSRLFERGRFGARLTRAGADFLTHAVSVLDALDGARRSVDIGAAASADVVRIGALPTIAVDLLPGVWSLFRQCCPGTRVEIRTAAHAALLDMLQAGEIDFVLGRMADPQLMVGVSFELLYVEPLAVVTHAAHPLAGANRVSLNETMAYPLIVSTKGTTPRHNTESFLQSRGLKLPANCIETVSVSVARLIAMQSDAVWFVPSGAVREDLADGLLARLPVATDGAEEPMGLLHRSDAQLGHSALEFMRLCRDAAAARRSSSAFRPRHQEERH